nr:hypothetical protein [Tanacetum cinerariifolium]
MEWRTKDGIVIKFPRQFRGYMLAEEEEVEDNEELKKVWEQVEFVISDSDSDLESTASIKGSSEYESSTSLNVLEGPAVLSGVLTFLS